MSVSATDADDPMTENAILSYSIIGQESIPAGAVTKTMFGINNETGAIYTRDVGLDREVGNSSDALRDATHPDLILQEDTSLPVSAGVDFMTCSLS